MTEPLWNSVVLAYEAQLNTLESARNAYKDALSALKASIQVIPINRKIFPEGVILGDGRLVRGKFDFELGSLEWDIKSENYVWAVIVARVAGQFAGSPGTLQLGVVPKDNPWQRERFTTIATRTVGWEGNNQNMAGEATWVRYEEVSLRENDSLANVRERLVALANSVGKIVAQIVQNEQAVLKFFKVYEECLTLLQRETSKIRDFEKRKGKAYAEPKWEDSYPFVQIDLDGKNMWIAIDPQSRDLRAYFSIPGTQDYAQRFAKMIKSETQNYDRETVAVTLMGQDRLLKESPDATKNLSLEAFRKYITLFPR